MTKRDDVDATVKQSEMIMSYISASYGESAMASARKVEDVMIYSGILYSAIPFICP